MSSLTREKIGKYIEVLTDYHANGSYQTLKNNVTLLTQKDYAIMIRTLNFERDDFLEDLIYVDKNAYEFLEKSKVYPDDILTNKIANPGSIYIMPDLNYPVSCGMNLFLIRFKPRVNQRYMYYCMKNSESYIKSFAHGTTTKTITKDEVRDIFLYIHSDLAEQNRIEHVLSVLDKKIQLNKKINDNLQQQVELLYNFWFTQFDFPDENGKPYRSSGGAMEQNKNAGRPIPIGWKLEFVTNNSLTTIIKPGVDKFETKTYLATAEVNGTAISNGNTIEYETRESRANMQPTENSVWFAKMKNSIKHLYLNKEMTTLIQSSILSTGFCGLQCTDKSFEYVASFIEHSYFETQKDMLAHGATQEAVNNDDLSSIAFVVPSNEILQLYHERTRGVYSLINKNICENQELIRLRDWLLPMLMNGQATIAG